MIIGFGHRSRVGKDTAGRLAQNIWGGHIISIASPIKAIAYQMFAHLGIQDEGYYEDNPQARDQDLPGLPGKTPVDIWIDLGKWGRQMKDTIWVELAVHRCSDPSLNYWITDIRCLDEVEMIKAKGGFVGKVDNPRVSPLKNTFFDDQLAGFGEWDFEIANTGTVDQLEERVRHAIGALISKESACERQKEERQEL